MVVGIKMELEVVEEMLFPDETECLAGEAKGTKRCCVQKQAKRADKL